MKTCNEVMTQNPIYCLPTDMAIKAAELMKNGEIGSVLVVEDEQTRRLVGIITDRDLVLKVLAEGRDAQTTPVEEVMTQDVVTCKAEDEIQKAVDAMADYQLRRIPVVDGDNKVLGIIAQADVATRFDNPNRTATVVKAVSQDGESSQ